MGKKLPKVGFTGFATYIFPDSTLYQGDWVDGAPQGTGSFLFRKKQEAYRGDVIGGKCTGQGHYFWLNRLDARYDGRMVNGIMHGQGEYSWDNGSYTRVITTGEFRNGKPVEGLATTVYPESPHVRVMFDGVVSERTFEPWPTPAPDNSTPEKSRGTQKACMQCMGRGTYGTVEVHGVDASGKAATGRAVKKCPYCRGSGMVTKY
jgi:hypothetical protein